MALAHFKFNPQTSAFVLVCLHRCLTLAFYRTHIKPVLLMTSLHHISPRQTHVRTVTDLTTSPKDVPTRQGHIRRAKQGLLDLTMGKEFQSNSRDLTTRTAMRRAFKP